jgi:peptidoglycan/LPS O-acetylase OafA/YrhL
VKFLPRLTAFAKQKKGRLQIGEIQGRMRYGALDGLRGLAALLVVLSHFSNLTGMWGNRLGDGGGQIGVMLFFLISGFLMGRLYLGEKITAGSALRFAQRRIARVVPLYLIVVLASFAAVTVFGTTQQGMYPITLNNLRDHLLFLAGVDVLWSVPVEVHFYMLFIVIWIATTFVRTTATAAILVVSALLCLFVPNAAKEHELTYHLHFFLCGVLVAIAHGAGIVRREKFWNIAFAVLAFAPLLLMPRIALQLFGVDFDLWKSPLILIVLTLLLVSALGSSLADLILGGRIGRLAGDISYSVYLLHGPIFIWLGFVRSTSTKIFLFVFLASVALLSWTSCCLIERPSRRMINAIGHWKYQGTLRSA